MFTSIQKKSLASKVLKLVLSIYILFAAAITLIQIVLYYQEEKRILKQEVSLLYETIHPNLSNSIWNFNDSQIESLISGLLINLQVIGIEIKNERGDLIAEAGQTKVKKNDPSIDILNINKNLISYKFPIVYNYRQAVSHHVGTTILYSSRKILLSRITYNIFLILSNAVIKTVILFLIAYFIFQKIIALPLSRLTVVVKGLEYSSTEVEEQQELNHLIKDQKDTELGILTETILKLEQTLANRNTEIKAYQEKLEWKIKERTAQLEKALLEERKAKESLHYLAHHDSLTKLPNRSEFFRILSHSLKSLQRQNNFLAVLFIDLDHFKIINDTLGHAAGDKLLQIVAKRLVQRVRESDTVCRLAGDEFTILLENLSSTHHIEMIAKNILETLTKPITLEHKNVSVSASIGISISPENSKKAEELIKYADTAMYYAKENGKSNYQFYIVPTS